MPFFFKVYKGCFPATVLSFLGSAFLAIGVVMLVAMLAGTEKDLSGVEGIIAIAAMFAFGAALSWLSGAVARRRARRRAEKAARGMRDGSR